MQLCLIEDNGFTGSRIEEALVEEMATVTTNQFLLATGLGNGNWFKQCPCTRCTGTLRVALVDVESSEFALWCPECGWTPSEGFEIEPNYYTLGEAAELLGVSYDTIHGMVKAEKIGAINFGHHRHGSWRIPKSLIDTIVKLNGDWTVFWEVQ